MKKFKNAVGLAYSTGKPTAKLKFRLALQEASDSDGIDWMKRFQDTWQYEQVANALPTIISTAYAAHLADVQRTPEQMAQLLKMS